jgi:hypothetical protein
MVNCIFSDICSAKLSQCARSDIISSKKRPSCTIVSICTILRSCCSECLFSSQQLRAARCRSSRGLRPLDQQAQRIYSCRHRVSQKRRMGNNFGAYQQKDAGGCR